MNFKESIIPHTVVGVDYKDMSNIANIAATYMGDGYARADIIRALQKSCINPEPKHSNPNPNLFEFLIKNPSLRPLVVTKTQEGQEIFDKTCANYYGIFKNHYFNDDDNIKAALDVCKIKTADGAQLASRELCEIATLLRRKTAQGIPESSPTYKRYSHYPKESKFVDENTPLTKKDIKLIKKLKQNDNLNRSMYETAKFLLSDKGASVSFVLENIDEINERKGEIRQLVTELNEKYPDTNYEAIDSIRQVLNREFTKAINDSLEFSDNSILLNTTKKLMDKNMHVVCIANVVKKLQTIIQHKVPINDKLVEDYLSLLEETNNNGKPVIIARLADILAMLIIKSESISPKETKIITLLKTAKNNNDKIFNVVIGMLNREADTDSILSMIKEKKEVD